MTLKNEEKIYVDGLESKLKDYESKNGWEKIKISAPYPANGVVKKGYIELPENVINGLREHFNDKSLEVTILVADIDENILSLSFPSPNEKIIKIEFDDLKEDIGVIKELSNLLAEWRVNLRNTESNILVWAEKGKWGVFADVSESPFKPSEIKEKLLGREKGKEDKDNWIISRLVVVN